MTRGMPPSSAPARRPRLRGGLCDLGDLGREEVAEGLEDSGLGGEEVLVDVEAAGATETDVNVPRRTQASAMPLASSAWLAEEMGGGYPA